MSLRKFLSIATERSTVFRAAKISLVVGCILVTINQGANFITGQMDTRCIVNCGLNFVVPYCVSTVSTVMARAENCPLKTGSEERRNLGVESDEG